MTAAIDASALLALLFAEPGAEMVADAIAGGAATSAVNLSEVATVLVRHRKDPATILGPVREQLAVEPFTDADAMAAAALYPKATALASRSRSDSGPQHLRPSEYGPSLTSTSTCS